MSGGFYLVVCFCFVLFSLVIWRAWRINLCLAGAEHLHFKKHLSPHSIWPGSRISFMFMRQSTPKNSLPECAEGKISTIKLLVFLVTFFSQWFMKN